MKTKHKSLNALTAPFLLILQALNHSSPAQTRTRTVDFDTIPNGATEAVLSSYLSGFGIAVSEVTPGIRLETTQDRPDGPFQSASGQFSLGWGGRNDVPQQFTLTFSKPLTHLSFTRCAELPVNGGTAFPEWNCTVYQGSEVAGNAGAPSHSVWFPDSNPAQTYSFDGNGITSITFSSHTHNFAGTGSPAIDDIVMTETAEMVAHYTFDGNAQDRSGNGNHGTLIGSPAFTPSDFSQAVLFDNGFEQTPATQFVRLPNSPSVLGLKDSSFTLAIRYLTTDTSQHNGRMFGNWGPDGGMFHNSTSGAPNSETGVRGTLGVCSSSAESLANSHAFTADGQWHWTITVVDRENGIFRYQVDDHLIVSKSLGTIGTVSFANILIGAQSDVVPFAWYSARATKVDDFRLYSQALSPEEVAQLVNRGEISVEQPEGAKLVDNASTIDFGLCLLGGGADKTFTIRNAGSGELSGLNVTFSGKEAADFSLSTGLPALVNAGGAVKFTVRCNPVASGVRNAVLHLASNAANDSMFDIALSIRVLDPNADDDGDKVTNAGEVNMASLGFNPLVDNTPLRTLLHDNALTMGLYREIDVQSLALSYPLLNKNAETGSFELRIGVDTSTGLVNWTRLTGFTATFDASNGLITLDIPPAASSAQFFRVLPSNP
jgi:hypothetical protein